ncbi:Pleckstrin domain [Trinorchestia longiramus]|nr:Pleckstrin domain [Trinorchestia longiramus]
MSGSMGSSAAPGNGLLSLHSSHANPAVNAADAAFLQDNTLGGSCVSSTSSSSRGSYGGSSLSDRASVSSSSQSGGSAGMGGLGIPPLPSNPPPTGYHPSFYYSEGGAYRGSNGPGSASCVLSVVNKPSFVTSNNNCDATVPVLGIPLHSSPQQQHLNNSLNSRMYESGIPMSNNMCSRDVCPDLLLRSPSVDPMRRDFPHSRSGSIDTTRNDYPHNRSGSMDTTRNEFPHHRSGSIDTTRNEFPQHRTGSIDTTRSDFPHHRSASIDTSRNDLPHHRSGSIDTSRSDFPHSRSGSIDTTRNNLPHFRSGSSIDANCRGEYPHPRSGSIDSTYRSNFHLRTGSTDTTGRPIDFRRSGSIDAPAGRNDYLARRAGAVAAAAAGSVDENLPQVAGGVPAADSSAGNEVLREAFMIKRSQNRSRFGPTNWRERWFVLTSSHIIYYDGDRQAKLTSGRKKEKGRVDLSSVECVERVAESAFDRDHVFQIVHVIDGEESCTLYVEAATQHDCSAWIHHVRQLVCENTGLQSLYHPGRPLRGLWSCCKSANPCTPITWVPASRGTPNTSSVSHSSPSHSVNTPSPQNFHTPTHSLHTSQNAHTPTHSLHSSLSAHTPTHSIHSSHSVHTSPLPHSPSSLPGHPGSPQGCSSPTMLGAAQLNGTGAPASLTAGLWLHAGHNSCWSECVCLSVMNYSLCIAGDRVEDFVCNCQVRKFLLCYGFVTLEMCDGQTHVDLFLAAASPAWKGGAHLDNLLCLGDFLRKDN